MYNYNNENVTCRKSVEKPKKQREKNHFFTKLKKLQVLSLIYNKFEKQDCY